MKDNEILVCDNHQDEYPTPLLSTMAFRSCELWCPYCGNALGMFDGGSVIPCTQELQDRHDKYKQYYSDYLHAEALTYASGTTYKGYHMKPSELPQEEKDRMTALRANGWKEGVKIEDIKFDMKPVVHVVFNTESMKVCAAFSEESKAESYIGDDLNLEAKEVIVQ